MMTKHPAFTLNAADMTGGEIFQPDLFSAFDGARACDGVEAPEDSQKVNSRLALNQAKSLGWGNLDRSQVSCVGAFGGAATQLAAAQRAEEAKTRATGDAIFLAMLDDIEREIERLNEEIADLKAEFAEEDEAWREKLAERILDPDEIPQRRDGETIEAYRARLEKVLVDRMLNEDGSIKERYKNDPELGRYAEWAKKERQINHAEKEADEIKRTLADDSLTDEETKERIEAAHDRALRGSGQETFHEKRMYDDRVESETRQRYKNTEDTTVNLDNLNADF